MSDFLHFVFPGLPVSKEKELAQKIIAALKGGEGSGNFGHAGRPGEVGGSSSQDVFGIPRFFTNSITRDRRLGSPIFTDEEKNNFDINKLINDRNYIKSKNETGYFVKDGKLILEKLGNEDSIEFNNDEIGLLKDSIFIHNHPGPGIVGGFSEEDIEFSALADLSKSIVITDRYIFTIERPISGWPNTVKKYIDYSQDKTFEWMDEESIGEDDPAILEIFSKVQWDIFSQKTGSKFTYEFRG